MRSHLWRGRHLRASQSSSIVRFLPDVLVSVCVCVCPLSVRLCSRLPPVFWQPFPLSTVLPLSSMDQPLSHKRLPCLPTFSLLFVALKLSLREAVGECNELLKSFLPVNSALSYLSLRGAKRHKTASPCITVASAYPQVGGWQTPGAALESHFRPLLTVPSVAASPGDLSLSVWLCQWRP